MKVIDIIKDSAVLLNLSDVVDLLYDAQKTDAEKLENEEVANLLRLLNLSIRELCTNYIPMLATTAITTANKTYPLSSLDNFIRVESASQNDNLVEYKIINRVLNFDEDGNYLVEYSSYPNLKSLSDDVSFLKEYGADVAVFGLCAYFCLTKGMFEDFDKFHQTYENKCSTLKEMKTFIMPQRRWE